MKSRKILSIILALILVLGTTTVVFAEGEEPVAKEITVGLQAGNYTSFSTNFETIMSLYGYNPEGSEVTKAKAIGTYDGEKNAWAVRPANANGYTSSEANPLIMSLFGTNDGTANTSNITNKAPYTVSGGGTCFEAYFTFNVPVAGHYSFTLQAGNYTLSSGIIGTYSTRIDNGDWVSYNANTTEQTNSKLATNTAYRIHSDFKTYYLQAGDHTFTFRNDELTRQAKDTDKFKITGYFDYFKLTPVKEDIKAYPNTSFVDAYGVNDIKSYATNATEMKNLYAYSPEGSKVTEAKANGTYDATNNAWAILAPGGGNSGGANPDGGKSMYAYSTNDGVNKNGNLIPTAPYTVSGGGTCFEAYMKFDVPVAGFYNFTLRASNYKYSTECYSTYSIKIDDSEWLSFNNDTYDSTKTTIAGGIMLHKNIKTYYLEPGEHTLTFRNDELAKFYGNNKIYVIESFIKHFELVNIGNVANYIRFDSDANYVEIGESKKIAAKGWYDELRQKVISVTPTYTSSNPDIAEVAEDGTVTAKKLGKVTISASYTQYGKTISTTTDVYVTVDGLYSEGGYFMGDSTINAVPAEGGKITAKASVYNSGNTDKEAVLILAKYTGGKLEDIDVFDVAKIASKEKTDLITYIEGVEKGDDVRMFLWNSLRTLGIINTFEKIN